MLSLLGDILTGVEFFGSFVLWGVETAFNAVGAALVAAWTALLALLPAMPALPSIGTPQWLQWLNWFYPVSDLLAGLVTIAALWVGFLGVRFVLRFLRQV